MAEKDPIRAERLHEVYKHLFAHHGVESKTQLADILKVQRTGLAAAFGGNKANLTDNLFKKICATFQGIFNLDYLLTGRGDLLTIEEEVKSEEPGCVTNQPVPPSAFEYSFAHETIAVLRQQVADKDVQIADLRADKERLLKESDAKSQTIDSLQARLHELEAYIPTIAADDPLRHHPFPVGVADKGETDTTRV